MFIYELATFTGIKVVYQMLKKYFLHLKYVFLREKKKKNVKEHKEEEESSQKIIIKIY